jgi:predicted nucleic acid-binding protein
MPYLIGKNEMKDKCFVDSNLWVYLFSKNDKHQLKRKRTKSLLRSINNISISNQVINEVSNVLYRKYKTDITIIEAYIEKILQLTKLYTIKIKDTKYALHLMKNYSLSFYDALITSSAIAVNCISFIQRICTIYSL